MDGAGLVGNKVFLGEVGVGCSVLSCGSCGLGPPIVGNGVGTACSS
jgi:hypothetical protein